MNILGEIVRLQLQRQSLKRGVGPDRYYDPSPLQVVDELILTPGGACATAADGGCLIDIHHAAHPYSRQRGGLNALSVGFARHYDAMRTHFGEHIALGCAAESIIVDGPAPRVTLADVVSAIAIETDQGLITLTSVIVAAPCAPFSRYALVLLC